MTTYKNLKASDFISTFQNTTNAMILDVRTEREFKQGHLDGAINIPSTEKNRLLSLDKNKTYFVHCRVGGRSAMVAHTMAISGYDRIYNLNDNIDTLLNVNARVKMT